MDLNNMQYTEVSNAVLRDSSLSLSGKGLYAMIYSYAGLPDFRLTLERLSRSCASSAYALRKAWRELKAAGYLKHYYTTADNGAFCHAYQIGHTAQACDGRMMYIDHIDRPNGDVQSEANEGDYTQIPNALLRSSTLSLPLKGLYAVLSYLFKIPGFTFRLKSLAALCKEKSKALASSWLKLKLAGLLKQHRRPSGKHNCFDWTYDLLPQPDLETPYFTSHRADGSIVTSLVAQHAAMTLGLQPQQSSEVKYDPLQKYINKALTALRQNKNMKISGESVPQADRIAAADDLSPDKLDAFSAQFTLPHHVRAPIPYVASALYQYAVKLRTPAPSENISFDDIQWALDVKARRIQSMDNPSDRDLNLVAEYKKLLSDQVHMSQSEFQTKCTVLFENWKSVQQDFSKPPSWGLKVLPFYSNHFQARRISWRVLYFSSIFYHFSTFSALFHHPIFNRYIVFSMLEYRLMDMSLMDKGMIDIGML